MRACDMTLAGARTAFFRAPLCTIDAPGYHGSQVRWVSCASPYVGKCGLRGPYVEQIDPGPLTGIVALLRGYTKTVL